MYINISYMYYILIVIGICILVSDICIFRLGVYEVYCVPCYILFVYFFVGSGFLWVGILIVYTEIPRVFWALGILFYLSLC